MIYMNTSANLTETQQRVLAHLASRPGAGWVTPGCTGWPVATIDALVRRGLAERGPAESMTYTIRVGRGVESRVAVISSARISPAGREALSQ